MSRYVQFFSCFLFLVHLVMCELPPNQRATIVELSEILKNNSAYISHWDITNNPNPCSWKGVLCSPNDESITSLSLSGFSIPSPDFLTTVCEIDTLQSIDLSNNRFGSIPNGFISTCGEINGLMLLNFSRNILVGSLPNFAGFPKLEFLDLSYNSLSGIIGLELHELVNLKSLKLSSNQFSGSVPIQLGKSMVLEELQIAGNKFQGEVPESLANYGNLTLIDLSANQLFGKIPERLGELSKLEVLVLSLNHLSGEIPEFISRIRTLTRFAANQNNFTGSIPHGVTMYVSNLDLSYNGLNGSIPVDLLSRPNLKFLDLSNNFLEGSIPENITPSLVRLRLGGNFISGKIPISFQTLQELTYLELDDNKLTGLIPPELGMCKNLTLLNLARNYLTGVLPVQLGDLTKLQELKLQFNNLVGEIPIAVTKLGSLGKLNISWNSMSGSIPSSISNLQSLSFLDLRENNLSGAIPPSIDSLGSLLELQLGGNRLSGKILQMPRSIQIALNLSNNLFEGSIPETFSRLRDLEILDLSYNGFSGEIPESLATMESLTQLLLSHNRLVGKIPKFRSHVTLDVKGNMVEPDTTTNSSPSGTPKKRKASVVVTVVVAVAATFLAAGIVVLVTLLISRKMYRINDDQRMESQEDFARAKEFKYNLLTTSDIHKSNIDFPNAMEVVSDPSNILLKTRFSTYYKAVMQSGMSYYVKGVNWGDDTFHRGRYEKFEKELHVLGKMSHPNIMTPLAYILNTDNAYLLYEYVEKGTLCDALRGSSEHALDWDSRFNIAIGVAQGLAFLHGCSSRPFLLLDLSSKSVMLKSQKEPQIGDIELHKVIDLSKSTDNLSMVAGSVGYIPPEYAYSMRVTMAGNVYSFGIILLELLTGKSPVSNGTELAKWVMNNIVQNHKMDQILDFRVIGTSPVVRSQMLSVLKVALACVNVSPEARPKTKSVLRMLLNAR